MQVCDRLSLGRIPLFRLQGRKRTVAVFFALSSTSSALCPIMAMKPYQVCIRHTGMAYDNPARMTLLNA